MDHGVLLYDGGGRIFSEKFVKLVIRKGLVLHHRYD